MSTVEGDAADVHSVGRNKPYVRLQRLADQGTASWRDLIDQSGGSGIVGGACGNTEGRQGGKQPMRSAHVSVGHM